MPLIPMVNKGEKGKQVEPTGMEIKMKMIDALDIPLTEGYVWAMGNAKGGLNVIEGKTSPFSR